MTRNDQIDKPRGRRFGRTRFLRRNKDENRVGQGRRRPFRRGRPNREGEVRNRSRRNPEDRQNRKRRLRENRGTQKRQNVDAGDLDRQLKNYWINQKDSSKTKEELKQIASKKFNDQLQDYWKKQKKDVQE